VLKISKGNLNLLWAASVVGELLIVRAVLQILLPPKMVGLDKISIILWVLDSLPNVSQSLSNVIPGFEEIIVGSSSTNL